ncbi:MAG: phasin family protein, partial [Alphaproteobacteria bacterium]|nr:phasin family protein [Alphaproteobacteria bacterium]
MAQQSKEQKSTATESALGPLAELQKAGLGNLMGMNAAWLEHLSDMSAEVLSFVAERVKEDVKTQHEILHCKDVNEMQAIQSRFLQKAIDQYQAETGKLVEMSTSQL